MAKKASGRNYAHRRICPSSDPEKSQKVYKISIFESIKSKLRIIKWLPPQAFYSPLPELRAEGRANCAASQLRERPPSRLDGTTVLRHGLASRKKLHCMALELKPLEEMGCFASG